MYALITEARPGLILSYDLFSNYMTAYKTFIKLDLYTKQRSHIVKLGIDANVSL